MILKNDKIKKSRLKIFVSMLLCINVFLSLFSTTFAESPAQNRHTVRVGYMKYDGFYNLTDGVKSGYGYDILQKLRIYENWNYEYIGYDETTSWDDMLKMLENGDIDLLAPSIFTEERAKKFNYCTLNIGNNSTVISIKSGNRKYNTSDYTNWNNISVGMVANNGRNDSFDSYAKEHGFTYHTVLCKNAVELSEKLQNGDCDIVIVSNMQKLDNTWKIDEYGWQKSYFIVKTGNTELLNQLNDGLYKLASDEPNYQDELYEKYYEDKNNSILHFSSEEETFINNSKNENKTYTAIINPNRIPLSYSENNQIKGLLTDISREIFTRTGLNIEFLTINSREEYYDKIKNKEVDVVCDYTDSSSKAENNNLIFIDTYYNSTVSRLARRNYDGTGNKCAIAGNSISGWLQGKGYEFIYVDSVEECCKAVQNGSADFTFSYTKCIQQMVYDDSTNSMMAILDNEQSTNFGMAVANTSDRLFCSILKKSIDSITTDDVSVISNNYTYYDQKDYSLKSIIYQKPIVFSSFVLLFAVLIFGIAILVLILRRKNAEAKSAIKLNEALQLSKTATKEKNDFYARMSHDMRTPMNGILGISELSMQENNIATLQDNMRKIHNSGEYLLGLINDTLDIQRMENGKLTLEPRVVYVGELVKNTTESIVLMAKEKGIDFKIVTNNAILDTYILIDPMRIKQIFINLFSNAVKFTPSGGTIEFALTVLERKGNIVRDRLTVTDTGLGMSQDFIDNKIFQPFCQEQNNLTNTYAGSGLGLSIVKNLVDMMGATISVESELGVGTKFTIDIDITCVDKKDVVQQNAHKQEDIDDIKSKFKGKLILLAEDHPLNAEITKKLLTKVGCEVEWAKNGRECVNIFENSTPHKFNAILMDIRMPEMDGLLATKNIRSSSHTDAKTIPIIAMTANAYQDDINASIESGMNAHLAKPIEPQKFYSTIAKFL